MNHKNESFSPSAQYRLPHYSRNILVFAIAINLLIFYVELMLTPSLPAMATQYGVTIAEVGLVTALYAMSGTALVPLMGKLGDIFGKKKVLSLILSLYAISVTITGFSPSFDLLLVFRTIQGIGLSIQPLLVSLVREEFPRKEVPKAQGMLSGASGIGFVLGLVLGSFISDKYGWQATYHTAVPFAVAFAILAFLIIKESPYKRPSVKVDYVGSMTIGIALSMVVLGLAEAPSWGWLSPRTAAFFTTGGISFIALLLYDRRYLKKGGEPILDLNLLSIRNVIASNLSFMLVNIAMMLTFQGFTFKFELPDPAGFSLSVFNTGISLLPFGISVSIFSAVTGFVVSRFGVKPIAIIGAIIGSSSLVACSLTSGYLPLLLLMFFVGTGLSLINASQINLLVLSVDPKSIGLASSMNSVFRNLGNSIGTPIAGSILSTFIVYRYTVSGWRNLPSVLAFHYLYYSGAACLIVIILTTIFSKEILGHERK